MHLVGVKLSHIKWKSRTESMFYTYILITLSNELAGVTSLAFSKIKYLKANEQEQKYFCIIGKIRSSVCVCVLRSHTASKWVSMFVSINKQQLNYNCSVEFCCKRTFYIRGCASRGLPKYMHNHSNAHIIFRFYTPTQSDCCQMAHICELNGVCGEIVRSFMSSMLLWSL